MRRTLVLVALAFLTVPFAAAVVPGASPALVGRWEGTVDGEVPAVSLVVLRDGRLLYWSGAEAEAGRLGTGLDHAQRAARARILDLSGATPVVAVPAPEEGGAGDLYCAGQVALPDGRVVVAGGNLGTTLLDDGEVHAYGLAQTLLFDPASATFSRGADMAFPRWYPTLVALPDGDTLAVAGTRDFADGNGNVLQVERRDVESGAWTTLPAGADVRLPMYPRLHVVPSGPLKGQVAYVPVGCTSCGFDDVDAWGRVQTLDPDAATWTVHAAGETPRDNGASVLLALRPPHYRAEVLTFGGAVDYGPPLATSTVFDLSADPPAARASGPLAAPRWYGQGVLLPTGEVFVGGGGRAQHYFSKFNPPALEAEIYDPAATDPLTGALGRWQTAAAMTVARGYHSTAALLPDGRVVMGGHVPLGVAAPDVTQARETRFEIYSPPYLFRGPRPTILGAPGEVAWGERFAVATPDAARIAQAVLVRPTAATHGADPEPRAVELEILGRDSAAVRVRAPPDAAVAPPGWYMLFLLADGDGGPVPSVARFVRLAEDI